MLRIRGIVIALLVIFSGEVMASHLLGGEITWECKANGQYEFTLKLYRDCTGIPLTPTTETISGPNGAISVTKVQINDLSPTCFSATAGYGCPPNGSTPVTVGSVEEHIYRGTTSLSGTPPPAGWEFSWTSCCRPTQNLANTSSGGYWLRSRMFPYTPPGAATPLNANQCYDSSPYFLEGPLSVLCRGNKFTYTQLAGDKEIDSLYYSWASPLQSQGTPITWNGGYSNTAPFPDASESAQNGPVVLNPNSGEVTTEVYVIPGNQTKAFASCLKIEAWKDCQKKAEIYRDFAAYYVQTCNPNNKPNLQIDTALYPILTRTGNLYKTRVYPGDQVYFEISAQDFDYNTLPGGGLVPQNIIFKAGGLQVNPLNYTSSSGCDGTPPCATLNPKAPQGSFSQALNNNVIFDWTPDCQHLAAPAGCGSIGSTYRFAFRMQDDGCATPAIEVATLLVEVIPGDPAPLTFTCLADEGNDELRLGWQRAIQDSALKFNYYMILGSNNVNGPYDTIQRIYDIDSLGHTFSNTQGYEYFYLIKSTGNCDFLSFPSDTLSLMKMTLTATPPGNAETANLTWSPLSQTLHASSSGLYEVWTEAPANSSNWVKVGETPNLNFTDQVTVCNSEVNYQIRVYDTVTGCFSASNLDSALFSDQTNKDIMYIDSVSVNANDRAIMSWQPTTAGDVVEYQVYYNDPVIGWDVVDIVPVGTPMAWEWAASQAGDRSEEFRIVSVDSCGNQSDDQIVQAHKTIHLRGYINKCDAFARVSWNNYQGFGKSGVDDYRLQVQTTDASGNVSGWNTIFIGDPEDTAFTQYNLKNNTEYCYRVRVRDTSGLRTSTSNQICRFAEVPQKSRILYLAQVTNDFNRNALKLNFLVDGGADVESFAIERAPTYQGPYQTIGTIGKPATPPYLIQFVDYGADPERFSYYYRVSATDSCGGRDTLSNFGRNIVLNVEERSNLNNYLYWTPYQQWDGVVATYNIYRKAGDEIDYSRVAQVNGNDTTYLDDVSDYRDSRGNFCYYVEAVEGNNSLGLVDGAGNPYNSLSNQECLNHDAKVFVPSGFRPGSSIPENQTFGPSLRFNDVEQYEFYIMNRWGVKVFETDDPTQRWDGTENGNEAAAGVYVYYLSYATPGGSEQEQRGTFTLVR